MIAPTNCDGGDGVCVKTWTEATKWCQSNYCSVVSQTKNSAWLGANGDEAVNIAVGTDIGTQNNAGWAACVKDKSNVSIYVFLKYHISIWVDQV